jgi:5-methylcytosine-specific restriction endonuclease McrA
MTVRHPGILGERTLVLNRSWMAITTTTVRRALTLVYQDAAQVICPERFKIPEIIVLRMFDGFPQRSVAFSRRNLYRRDQFTCQYCGSRPGAADLTIDHVVPRSQGGRTSWQNCVLACVGCNKRKAHRSLDESGMSLQRAPTIPRWTWDVELSMAVRLPSWERFLPRHGHAPGPNGAAANGNGHGNGHGANGRA